MVRKIDRLYDAIPCHFFDQIHAAHLVKQPLSDTDILEIQEKFLSNGFQYLKSQNINQGRTIIYAFLDSLSRHHNIACLTVNPQPIRDNITDLYAELYGGFIQSHKWYVEEYLIEHFYFDFMWIEATNTLLSYPWFQTMTKKIMDLSIDQQIPILICVYADE